MLASRFRGKIRPPAGLFVARPYAALLAERQVSLARAEVAMPDRSPRGHDRLAGDTFRHPGQEAEAADQAWPISGPVLQSRRALRGWAAILVLSAVLALLIVYVLESPGWRSREIGSLRERHSDLRARVYGSNSIQGCLEPGLGNAVEAGCEAAIFADPGALAAAVALSSERLAFLSDALKVRAPRSSDLHGAIRDTGQALAQDRFGIVAYLLRTQRGCNPDVCPEFSLLQDPARVRENMARRHFEATLARYRRDPGAPQAAEAPETGVPSANLLPPSAATPEGSTGKPLPPTYTLPSADSIPRISIMIEERGSGDGKTAPSDRPASLANEARTSRSGSRPQAKVPSRTSPAMQPRAPDGAGGSP